MIVNAVVGRAAFLKDMDADYVCHDRHHGDNQDTCVVDTSQTICPS